ncbi:MAG: AraC family transcriptional regulator [Deltaproteobacteria bacterium]|nr:AraC family transcriptional regulator [Deltaproteobacteria bacterium]
MRYVPKPRYGIFTSAARSRSRSLRIGSSSRCHDLTHRGPTAPARSSSLLAYSSHGRQNPVVARARARGEDFPAGLLERCDRALRGAVAPTRRTPTFVSPLPGLRLLRYAVRTEFEATLYEPVVCVVLRGRKETTFGERTFDVGAGACLLVSHDLPVVSRIVEAPYLALLLDVNLDTLRGLHDELGTASSLGTTEARALEVHDTPPPLLDALGRYVAVAESPTDAKVLGPMLAKEVHYRLLTAPFGGMLRSLLRDDSSASAVANAITQIRRRFRESLVVADLAHDVGMSVSAFHRQFKAVTASSPLQYQKDLRLLEARRMLRLGTVTVSAAAYDVGYESPNQFSREYARKFGWSPKHDARSRTARPPSVAGSPASGASV